MCNHCDEDPRDGIHAGLRALRGLVDLVGEAANGPHPNDFKLLQPDGLAELLRMVDDRLQHAGARIHEYVPRGFKAPE